MGKKSKTSSDTKDTTPAAKLQSAKDLLSNLDNINPPDLNSGESYPIHPDRIWPD